MHTFMVYVDNLHYWPSRSKKAYAVGKRHGHMWCHLWADNINELIKFALALGLKESWLQQGRICKHFDLVPPYRERAIANGAMEMSLAEWYRNNQHISNI